MSNFDSTTAWVTVAEAADKAQVDSGTIRQWYRAGRVPTRRAEGERGAFLVPLELVLSLVNPAAEVEAPLATTPSIDETLRELANGYSSAETDALKQELVEAGEQLEFLRSQLAEATAENRTMKQQLQQADDQRADLRAQLADAVDERKGVEARLLTVEAEVTQLRRSAARGSITDSSWLDQQTPAYESPVRRQALTSPSGGPSAPFSDEGTSELSDLLAATRADGAAGDDATTSTTWTGNDADDRPATTRAVWTDETPHPPLGESPDDLLPEPDKKGRFGKK